MTDHPSVGLSRPTRRSVVLSSAAAASLVSAWPAAAVQTNSGLKALEDQPGVTRIGVAAVDLATGKTLSHRGGERFAMCSTFKWVLAGLVLTRVDAGSEDLERGVPYAKEDLVTYSPVTEKFVEAGSMSVRDLCAAAVEISDNTAANLLLATLGGPAGFTDGVRAAGDQVTRLDRWELELNNFVPGDPRDTTTPVAMMALMQTFLFGSVLSRASRDLLRGWMIGARTGFKRLRAGVPEGWIVGDKTGTNTTNSSNDVAFALPAADQPPAHGPLLIVSYLNMPKPLAAEGDAIHAAVARHVVKRLTS